MDKEFIDFSTDKAQIVCGRPPFPYGRFGDRHLCENHFANVAQGCEGLLHCYFAVEDWVKFAEQFRT